MIPAIIICVLLGCLVHCYIAISNSINRIKLKIEESLSGVEIHLRQRYDILTQGKVIAQQYTKYEQQVFEGLRRLFQIPSSATIDQLNEASQQQEQAVKNLFALREAYPELRSAEIFNHLIRQLSEETRQYTASRRAVNGNITKLNNYVVTFPSSVICTGKGITKLDYLHEENLEELKDIDMNMGW